MKNKYLQLRRRMRAVKRLLFLILAMGIQLHAVAVHAPDSITLSNNQVPEELAGEPAQQRFIGILTGFDQDIIPGGGEVLTFSIVNNTGVFRLTRIDHRRARLSKTISRRFDHESFPFEGVTIEVRDIAGNTYRKHFWIEVTDRDDPPYGISLSSDTIPENSRPGFPIATLSILDVDNEAEDYTFSTNDPYFSVNGRTLVNDSIFDHERRSRRSVRVTARLIDGNEEISQNFDIDVTDVNERPKRINLGGRFIVENNEIGARIGFLSTSDPDAGDQHVYTLERNLQDNDLFSLDGNVLKANAHFDYETVPVRLIQVTTTDRAGLTHNEFIEVHVTDVFNDGFAPRDIRLSRRILRENNRVGATIGFLSAFDWDEADRHTFTLNNFQNDFVIVGDTLKANTVFDYENRSRYPLSITVTDEAGGKYIKVFYIVIWDVYEGPSDILLSNNRITENNLSGDLIGELSSVDDDPRVTHEYRLLNNAGGRFKINGERLEANTTLSHEDGYKYVVTVESDNGEFTYSKNLTIYIGNENEAPTAIHLSNASIREGNVPGELIGHLKATDEDLKDRHSFSLLHNPQNLFGIDGDKLIANKKLSFNEPEHVISIRTTDREGVSFDQDFTITVIAKVDKVGPEITQYTPPAGAIGVTHQDELVVTFNEPIRAGSGHIKVIARDYFFDKIIDSPVTLNGDVLFIEGSQLRIVLSGQSRIGDFTPGRTYYVTIAANAVRDMAGNALSNPITDKSWTFVVGKAKTMKKSAEKVTDYSTTAVVLSTEGQLVQVFPNPADDVIQVASEVPAEVAIVDLQGSILIRSLTHSAIDISQLSAGVYFARVLDENKQLTVLRFIKSK
ncbi:MAG: Ig-like domain-containing protein [Bacteroidota bacterium]